MAGIWVDQGLEDMHKQLLGVAALGEPAMATLYTVPDTPTNTTVYTDLSPDLTIEISINPLDWAFVLDAVLHRDQASITLNFDLSAHGGETYYGIMLYDTGHSKLYYADLFSPSYTVPGPGLNPAPFVLIDYRQNC